MRRYSPGQSEDLAKVHHEHRYNHEGETNPRRIRDRTETEGLDEFVFLLLLGEADEQSGQGRHNIKDQGPVLAVSLRYQLGFVETPKNKSDQEWKGD